MSTEDFSLKEKAVSFLTLVAAGKVREAYQTYIGPDFCHHNPFFHGNKDSLLQAMVEDAENNPDKILEIKIAIQEKEMVTVYSHMKQKPEDSGVALVHIFRFTNNQIAELWDLGQPIPENSPNENGMF